MNDPDKLITELIYYSKNIKSDIAGVSDEYLRFLTCRLLCAGDFVDDYFKNNMHPIKNSAEYVSKKIGHRPVKIWRGLLLSPEEKNIDNGFLVPSDRHPILSFSESFEIAKSFADPTEYPNDSYRGFIIEYLPKSPDEIIYDYKWAIFLNMEKHIDGFKNPYVFNMQELTEQKEVLILQNKLKFQLYL